MRDPYLYENTKILINNGNIRDEQHLKKAEADITKFSMAFVLTQIFKKFDTQTIQGIHKIIFGDLYPWAGEFRTIQIVKFEEVLGGDTVRYTEPDFIKSELRELSKEIAALQKTSLSANELVFRLVRITARLWQIHPFREGNTRTVVAFSILLAQHLGLQIDYALIEQNAAYVRNSLVWASQGIYSKFEYLERIFFDAAGIENETDIASYNEHEYKVIEGYNVSEYKEMPHEYIEEDK